jgi:gas vesicle structural protein
MTELERLGPDHSLSLAELVNRVLDRGAIVAGEVVISVAGIDLIYLGLQIVIASAESMDARLGLGPPE